MITKRILYFIITIFSIVWSPLYAQQTLKLTVGSYNIRYDNENDRNAGNGWENRLPVITSLIEFIDYDVVGLQEVLAHQLHHLQGNLTDYAYVGIGRDDGKEKGEFAPIFYKKDRFKALKSGVFWLSETPEEPSKGWDASLPRICTWLQLKEKKTGKVFWYFNLHMDHVGIQARANGSHLVLERIRSLAKGQPAFLTGDFNVDQHNEIYNILHQSGYVKDSYELAPSKFAWNGTFNAFDNNLWTDSRIDHVFVTNTVSVKHYAVLTESYRSKKDSSEEIKKGDFPKELSFKQYEARLPSDHFPIIIRVEL